MANLNDYGIANPEAANLTELTQQQVVCYITQSVNEYDGNLGARISSIFVIGGISTLATFFPVVARRVPKLHIPLYVYLFARYFGSGVIVATAFIHLLDPAYSEIGPATCVGLTGGWAEYSWPPAIALAAVMGIFVLDFAAERYVEIKYGASHEESLEDVVTGRNNTDQEDASSELKSSTGAPSRRKSSSAMDRARNLLAIRKEHVDRTRPNDGDHDPENDAAASTTTALPNKANYEKRFQADDAPLESWHSDQARHHAVQQQLAAFLILEFGVIFHSVIIGLNLGVAGTEFSTLYVVLIFHQSFEGLGIGARLSSIPFHAKSWVPWLLCSAYGLTTPLSISIGLGLRTTYNSGSFTANVVSGVLDSISAGILIYTGLVELLARDFLFNPVRTNDPRRLAFMMVCVFLGAGIMALLGKWA